MKNIFRSYHTLALIKKQVNKKQVGKHDQTYRFYENTLKFIHEGKVYSDGAFGFSIIPKILETDKFGKVNYETMISGILYFHGPQAHKSEVNISKNCPSDLADIVIGCLNNSEFPIIQESTDTHY